MSDQPKQNKGGRPAKYPGEGRRPSLSLRVRGGLYEKLQAAAVQSERTISEEMEHRLLRSFESDDLRRVVREEIAAALSAPVVHTVTDVSATRVRPNIVARIPRYDHLPS